MGDSFRSLGNLEGAVLSYSDVKTLIQDDTRAHEGIGILLDIIFDRLIMVLLKE